MIERHYDRYGSNQDYGNECGGGHIGSGELAGCLLGRYIKSLRAKGVPVMGYTWFPLFTMIDWRYRFGKAPLEDYFLELGLYRLNRDRGPR